MPYLDLIVKQWPSLANTGGWSTPSAGCAFVVTFSIFAHGPPVNNSNKRKVYRVAVVGWTILGSIAEMERAFGAIGRLYVDMECTHSYDEGLDSAHRLHRVGHALASGSVSSL